MATDENAKIATELQIKYELYFITLTFTLLGLAVQTVTTYDVKNEALFEILAWIFFLASGTAVR